MPVDRHQPRGFFLHQLQHGKQWRTPKSTINLTAPSRFSNVGKPSPSPGIDGKKNTAQNTPHGKTPRLRILFFVWSPRTSNLSFAKKPSQEFCCSKNSALERHSHSPSSLTTKPWTANAPAIGFIPIHGPGTATWKGQVCLSPNWKSRKRNQIKTESQGLPQHSSFQIDIVSAWVENSEDWIKTQWNPKGTLGLPPLSTGTALGSSSPK